MSIYEENNKNLHILIPLKIHNLITDYAKENDMTVRAVYIDFLINGMIRKGIRMWNK